MSNGKDQPYDAITALDEQIRLLKEAAPFSVDPCLIAKFLAVADSTVRQKLEERLRESVTLRAEGCRVP